MLHLEVHGSLLNRLLILPKNPAYCLCILNVPLTMLTDFANQV